MYVRICADLCMNAHHIDTYLAMCKCVCVYVCIICVCVVQYQLCTRYFEHYTTCTACAQLRSYVIFFVKTLLMLFNMILFS